jgi:hypothetical protein
MGYKVGGARKVRQPLGSVVEQVSAACRVVRSTDTVRTSPFPDNDRVYRSTLYLYINASQNHLRGWEGGAVKAYASVGRVHETLAVQGTSKH